VGLVHAGLNSELGAPAGSWLARFAARAAPLDAQQRARLLEEDEELDAAHAQQACGGQSRVPDADEDVNLHFVCFVHCNGGLYELDGRRPAPLRRGDSSEATLLSDAAAVTRRVYMAQNPESTSFNLMALAPAASDE